MRKRHQAVLRMAFLALPIGTLSTAAQASQQSGTVLWFAMPAEGSNGVTMSGTRTTKPACATDNLWALPATKQNASAVMAAVITARVTGASFLVVGTGTCDPSQPSREEIAYITFGE